MANDFSRKERKMEDDIELIENVIKHNDVLSLKKIISRHSGIYIDMVKKYIPNTSDGLYQEDLLEEKDSSIYAAILNYDKTKKAKFSTYLGNITKWKCLNLYNRNIKFKHEAISNSNTPKLSCDSNIEEIEEKENLERIFTLIEESKDSRIKNIFKMRYQSGKKVTPWKKIAKKLDLSIQGCINIHNNYLQEVKKYVQ